MNAKARGESKALRLAFSDPRGCGEPILFVHGFFHNRSVWEDVAASLPQEFRPLLLDLRGHGESPWSAPGEYGLDAYAADVLRMIDEMDLARVHLVGHSLGGNVLTLLVAARPERFRSLTLVDTGPALEASGTHQVASEVENVLHHFSSVPAYRKMLSGLHPLADSKRLDRLAETGIVRRIDGRFEPAMDPAVLGLELGDAAAGASFDVEELESRLWAALAQINCPVLLVRGGLSGILGKATAERMVAEALKDGRLVTLPGAGHSVMLDDGPGLIVELLKFLAAVLD